MSLEWVMPAKIVKNKSEYTKECNIINIDRLNKGIMPCHFVSYEIYKNNKMKHNVERMRLLAC